MSEELSKRIDDVHKRFDDLRGDINLRFEDVNRRFDDVNRRFDDLRGDVNQRFDDVNRRFDEVVVELRELRADMRGHFRWTVTTMVALFGLAVPIWYSTVTLLARFLGWSTSRPRRAAMW